MDGTSDRVACNSVRCFNKFLAHQPAILEPEGQRGLSLSDGHGQLGAEAIHERHAKAVKLDWLRHSLLVREFKVTVNEVEVGCALDGPAYRVASTVIFDAKRALACGYSNALRMTQLMLS